MYKITTLLLAATLLSLLCYLFAIVECEKKKKSYKVYPLYFCVHAFSLVLAAGIPPLCRLFHFVMTVILLITVIARGDYPAVLKIPPMNAKAKIVVGVCVATLLIFLLIQHTRKMNVEFSWFSTWDAPEHYPAELLNGAFILEGEGEISLLPGWTRGHGWGKRFNRYGGKQRPLPVGLYVYWYSFAEDKFYDGAFKLPRDRMLAFFREGFNRFRSKRHITYGDITVGIAPGGMVSVWLSGREKQVEIGYFRGKDNRKKVRSKTSGTIQLSLIHFCLNRDFILPSC